MAKTLQFRRYTTSNLASITGLSGELIVDTTLNAITVHTGSQPGGFYTANAITLQAAFNQANAAYAQANTDLNYLASNVAILLGIDVSQNSTSNLAFAQANAAYNSQNVTGTYANSAYLAANGANANAITSGAYANGAFVQANAAFTSANAINLTQNTSITAAFTQANAAFLAANTPTNVANSAAIYANAAFTAANTAANTIPQNLQTTNYVLQLSDAGKHIYYTQASNTTLYIPTTSNVAFSNGTTIMIVSKTTSGANVTVSPNTGVTMYLAGNTTSISRNVTTYGMATLIQVAANTWFINGTGVA